MEHDRKPVMSATQDAGRLGTGGAEPQRTSVTTADLYRAAWAASIGSALEYYDFALYNLASALIFAPLFFPSQDPSLGLIASFGTYFLGFAIRPVGGIVFGVLGDRYGRKFVLMATILLMGTASTLIGVLPTYATAGVWAPILLIGCRLLQGLGAGAEQAGAAVLMAEYAPVERRGFFAALPFMGVLLGTVLAALIYFVLVRVEDISQSWLWRIPFLLSVFIIAIMRRAVILVGLSIAYAAQSFSDWWQSLQLYPSDAEINPIVSMNWLTVRPFNTCTFLKTSSAITGCCAAAFCAKPTRPPSTPMRRIAAAPTMFRLPPNFIGRRTLRSYGLSSGCVTVRQ